MKYHKKYVKKKLVVEMEAKEGAVGLGPSEADINLDSTDIFAVPDVNQELLDGFSQEYQTNLGGNLEGPYEFDIRTDGKFYILLLQTRLFGEFTVTKKDGTPLTTTDKVALTNNAAHGLFKHVEVQINEIGVSDTTSSCYGYKSMIETLISYGKEAKKTHLTTSLIHKDEAGKFESTSITGDDTNDGFPTRRKMLIHSTAGQLKPVQFEIPIFNDFLMNSKMLPSACRLRIKFVRQSDSFVLMSDADDYKININNLRLYCHKVRLRDDILLEHRRLFTDYSAVFNVARTRIKTYLVYKGAESEVLPNVVKGQLPRNVVIAMVDTTAFNGSVKKNPYNFQHFDIETIFVRKNGVSYPAVVPKNDFKNGLAMRSYRALFDSTGIFHGDRGNDITYDEFINGYTLFAYDLSPDKCNG